MAPKMSEPLPHLLTKTLTQGSTSKGLPSRRATASSSLLMKSNSPMKGKKASVCLHNQFVCIIIAHLPPANIYTFVIKTAVVAPCSGSRPSSTQQEQASTAVTPIENPKDSSSRTQTTQPEAGASGAGGVQYASPEAKAAAQQVQVWVCMCGCGRGCGCFFLQECTLESDRTCGIWLNNKILYVAG